MEWFSHWGIWHWLILGFVLLIAEIVISGVFLLWWGISALFIALITLFFPQLSLTILWICFAVLAFMLTLIWWKYQHHKDLSDQARTILNQRNHAMLGKKGIVQEVAHNNIGRAYFADTTWRIQGSDLQVGDVVEVIGVDGITLLVTK